MSEDQLVIELYEYFEDADTAPPFRYILCPLEKCLSRKKTATLEEIIRKGFESMPAREQNRAMEQEFLRMIDEAAIGRISVSYVKPSDGDPYVELTNVTQVSITDSDVRRDQSKRNDIILYGRYRLADNNGNVMRLRDAQRLSLFYSNHAASHSIFDPVIDEETPAAKDICLNITYLQK